jgi:hypothetical protein
VKSSKVVAELEAAGDGDGAVPIRLWVWELPSLPRNCQYSKAASRSAGE